MNNTMKSLYQELQEAGIECSNWCSDLYFIVSPQSTAILKNHPVQQTNATRFHSEIDGAYMYDVPFAFDPYWTKKGM